MKIAPCWRTNISNYDLVYFIDFLYMYHYYSLIFITAKPINQPMVRFVYSYDEMYVILKILYFWSGNAQLLLHVFPKILTSHMRGRGSCPFTFFDMDLFFSSALFVHTFIPNYFSRYTLKKRFNSTHPPFSVGNQGSSLPPSSPS